MKHIINATLDWDKTDNFEIDWIRSNGVWQIEQDILALMVW